MSVRLREILFLGECGGLVQEVFLSGLQSGVEVRVCLTREQHELRDVGSGKWEVVLSGVVGGGLAK